MSRGVLTIKLTGTTDALQVHSIVPILICDLKKVIWEEDLVFKASVTNVFHYNKSSVTKEFAFTLEELETKKMRYNLYANLRY